MKKWVGTITAIMFLGMFWPLSVTKTQAGENTKQPLNTSEKPADLFRAREEAEILWKLGRRGEAMEIIEGLLFQNPEDAALLEMAAYFHLDRNEMDIAEELTDRLFAIRGRTPVVLNLQGSLYLQQRKWEKAREVFEELYREHPDDVEIQRGFIEIFTQQREWKKARSVYDRVLRGDQRLPKDIWNYKELLEVGAPNLETSMTYFHRPNTQRDYLFEQKGGFWAAPWVHVGLGISQGIYKIGGSETTESLDKTLVSHFVETQLFYNQLASLYALWKTTYYHNKDFHEMNLVGRFNHGVWRGEVEYGLNQTVRDPIRALDREGVRDRLRMNNKLIFWGRLEAGHELDVEWYRLNGKRNQVNGSHHLGHKISSDAFVSLTLFREPYLSVNYHFREGHWNKKFKEADTVIGFLPEEQVHFGGIYAEHHFGSFTEMSASVTRGSDRKRDVDFVIWAFQTHFWLKDRMKVSFLYEYDYGDSGTSGTGNTQIMSMSMKVYF